MALNLERVGYVLSSRNVLTSALPVWHDTAITLNWSIIVFNGSVRLRYRIALHDLPININPNEGKVEEFDHTFNF